MTASPYAPCGLCPRRCGANRRKTPAGGEPLFLPPPPASGAGFCGESAELRIALASIHRGEEPPVTGRGGSGTIFVTGCGLGCVFCQNRQISRQGMGRPAGTGEFADICLALQERGAENINIVTGSHAVPALVEGLEYARGRGLVIPVLWNSSGYENPETLSLLESLVDVWLPDLKTLDPAAASKYFGAADYPAAVTRAILKMLEFRPVLRYGGQGAILSGVIIRHLVLPGHIADSGNVIRWFAEHCMGQSGAGRALLSVMTQYTPVAPDHPDSGKPGAPGAMPGRFLRSAEYDAVLGLLERHGVEDGFLQEPVRDSAWLPDFRRENPFSSELSIPVWHWRNGFAVPRPAAGTKRAGLENSAKSD